MPYSKDDPNVAMDDALDAWEPHAMSLLTDTAKRYNGFVTYKQLAEVVQQKSGIMHDGLLPNWIGSVLGRVVEHCARQQVPHLSSLCVKEDGKAGDGYRHVLITYGDIGDMNYDQLDDHAAEMRLRCYRHFGAQLPAGGGVPTLTPKAKATKDYKKALAKLDEPPKLCPKCNTVLPLTGTSDDCG